MKGRPIEWTQEKKDKAIEIIFTEMAHGKSLRQILDHDNTLPARKTFYEWIAIDQSLSNHYARVSEIRADMLFDQIIDIADENHNDVIITEDGIEITNHDVIQRARLKIDARKWVLSKMVPKKYGDKTDITTNGKDVNIPIIEWVKSKTE
jgi:hypothetical protein